PPAGHARGLPARRRAPGARREGERRARRAHTRHPAGHRRRDHAGVATPHAPDPAGALPRSDGGGPRRPGAARHLAGMTPRPGTLLRPTGRGIVVLGLCPVMWLLGDLARVTPARQLAAALLIMLVIGAAGIVVSSVGLRARRYLVDDAVPVGSAARVMLELTGSAWLTVVPLGRGIVREHLPEPLGGQGDLRVVGRVPHVLPVGRRSRHDPGPYSLIGRDLLVLSPLRRTVDAGLRLTGLPVIGEMGPAAERAAGILREGARSAAAAPGIGEIGPIARPYASGDDIRRINWRASARTGQLMTREEEPAS